MKKKIVRLLCIFIACSSIVVAQKKGFRYIANINSIQQSGLYNIVLTPSITAHLQTDYSDIRIVNETGKWIPHLLRIPNTTAKNSAFQTLPIIKKENYATFTELVVKNEKSNIDNLSLTFKNTAVERFGILTGSDDMTNWFSINDSILIKPVTVTNKNTTAFNIDFPLSNYQFYKLIVNNKDKAPLNILGVQTNANQAAHSLTSLENPPTIIQQKDSGKYSFIKVTQPAAFHFNSLVLTITGSKYFNRSVDVYVPTTVNNSFSHPGNLLQSFTISNNSALECKLPLTKATVFYLVINNQDNLPLRITNVKTLNSLQFATAYLEKGQAYQLIMDNEKAVFPDYDLNNISVDSTINLPAVGIGNITLLQQNDIAKNTFNNQSLLWIAIVAAGLVLAFFTYKLVNDMNKVKL